jgi:hypothetical protein
MRFRCRGWKLPWGRSGRGHTGVAQIRTFRVDMRNLVADS